ncbi:NUDIX hydrolase [Tsukamurella soli]|uniref:NUDIX domain-containing protein n=1 Tax=Tsukamurella soli TaxID=644556 RepID=A0ABP8JBK3_9ACTN
MDPTIRLPAGAEAAAARAGAPEPRMAASVVLLRDGGELEVHLLRRASTMAFAAGTAVFPGGGLDAGDGEPVPSWVGPDPAWWAERFGTDADQAMRIVVAAVRETFEECGVLLACGADGAVPDTSAVSLRRDRERLAAHEISLADLLTEHDLTLRADLLVPWALWITPPFEKRRYRTYFLAARVPDGQTAVGGSREAVSNEWHQVTQAIRAADARELPLMPPQYCTMLELYELGSTAAVFAADRAMIPVQPHVEVDTDGPYLALPDALVQLGRRVGEQMYGGDQTVV